jgi:hypothetical protein
MSTLKAIFKKTHFPSRVLLLVLISTALLAFKKGDCTNETMRSEAVDRLKKFTLLQEFPVYLKKKGKKDPVEYKKQMIMLNSGVRYKFYTIKNPEYEGTPILTIYNNDRLEFMIGSTYSIHSKKFYNEVEFECKTSGNYCLAFSFHEGFEGCALGVFSSLIKE